MTKIAVPKTDHGAHRQIIPYWLGVCFSHWDLGHSNFFRASCFVLRISDLFSRAGGLALLQGLPETSCSVGAAFTHWGPWWEVIRSRRDRSRMYLTIRLRSWRIII